MGDDTRWHDRDPKTPAELYDMLRWAFGLGSYDDTSDEMYFKSRNTEIAKIKASLTRRKISLADAVQTARYCKAQGLPVVYVTDLWKHLAEAKSYQRSLPSDIQTHIEQAIEFEHGLNAPDSEQWIERLNRAVGSYRKEVLDEWQRARATVRPAAQA